MVLRAMRHEALNIITQVIHLDTADLVLLMLTIQRISVVRYDSPTNIQTHEKFGSECNIHFVVFGTLIPLLLLVTPPAYADPKHCYSYGECYNMGYSHGYTDEQNGYGPVYACHDHSQAYCDGYRQGCRDAASGIGSSGVHARASLSNKLELHQELSGGPY